MKKEQHHNKELGFQVPQDFFNNFEEEMITQWKLEEKLGKDAGFQVPDGYFESLEQQLLPVTETKVVKLHNGVHYKSILYPVLAIAAVLAVILSLNSGKETLEMASLETEEIEVYLTDEASLYDDATVEILFAGNDILDNIHLTESIETDELYNYLQEELELNEIITE
ncbi:hypothetical protein [Nonlabens sp.]|uniref:hypothetical protein n=1 Tax=Nonlabens sp. TaxID=1888209 RepID=UPI003F69CE9F